MLNRDRWNYDSTFTVRVEQSTKDRLWQAAQARGKPFREHIRDILTRAKLPEELLEELPPQCCTRVEKPAARSGKDGASMLVELIPAAISALFDSVHYGV